MDKRINSTQTKFSGDFLVLKGKKGMLYQSDEEPFGYGDSEATESGSDEELRAQQDAEEFPLGRRGPDSTMLERLGEAEEEGTERTVTRDLILREINKNVQPGVIQSSSFSLSLGKDNGKKKRKTIRKNHEENLGKRKGLREKRKKEKDAAQHVKKKVVRYNNITGEPTKEFLAKNWNVWKVQKIQKNKQKRGQEILESTPSLDQYVIESFVYSDHHFELDEFQHKPDAKQRSFQEEMARRWVYAHPEKPLEYLDEENKILRYHPKHTEWETLPWNRHSEWFLDVSKLIEDDRLCIIQMLYEVTIDPYKQLIESLPFNTRKETETETETGTETESFK